MIFISERCKFIQADNATSAYRFVPIVRFFPHEILDLSLVLTTFSLPVERSVHPKTLVNTLSWEFRYIMLLWLSLICMIPFDLMHFDQIPCNQQQGLKTSENIQKTGLTFLNSPGKEREAAALVLARLMLRRDMASDSLKGFLDCVMDRLECEPRCDVFEVTGIIQALCSITKLALPSQLQTAIPQLYRAMAIVDSLSSAAMTITVRKLRTKLAGRVAILCLSASQASSGKDNYESMEEVEDIIQQLLTALEDKDTIVRWSGAKYLARLAKRLPSEFACQVSDALLDLFGPSDPGTDSNLSSVSEHTWHGACLASAEFLRGRIFPLSRLQRLLDWTIRALHFERRKGVQNIGSGVRDAASYVMWSIGRAFTATDVGPWGERLAIELVLQSLFDREVHIRRAGSAAFQENVGRLGIFPHGIQVLQLADFFTVGLRRSAFLIAAPEVAKFEIYRESILNHLITVCISHWDNEIRELASQSVGKIASYSIDQIPEPILQIMAVDIDSKDMNKVHGTLLTLAQIGKLYHHESSSSSKVRQKIFMTITRVQDAYLESYSSNPLLIGICEGLLYSFSADQPNAAEFPSSPFWNKVLTIALKRPDDTLHFAIQRVLHKFSSVGVGLGHIRLLSTELQKGRPVAKQATARLLGGFVLKMEHARPLLEKTLSLLLDCADSEKPITGATIEMRRNAIESLVSLLTNLNEAFEDCLSPEQFSTVISVLLGGVRDYTTDERGDVGSWVRSSSLKCLETLIDFCTKVPSRIPRYITRKVIKEVLVVILKQTVESIDSLRERAWYTTSRMLCETLSTEIDGFDSLAKIFNRDYAEYWRELSWTFPKTLELLKLCAEDETGHMSEYIDPVVEGIASLIGGQGNRDAREAAQIFCSYLNASQNVKLVREIVRKCLSIPRTRVKEPKSILSALETLAMLLELPETLSILEIDACGQKLLRDILLMATHGLGRPNFPMPRVVVGMKIVIRLTSFETTRTDAGQYVQKYLTHRLPRIRSMTAEMMYNQLQFQAEEMPELEELLTGTDW
ncbi:armadillo-type protein [Melampsora americana]|nr:armadillo-type protein [Melampsora americana]